MSLGVAAEVVDVPNYSIVNMKTREAPQIRSDELYDLVTQTLIDNGGEIIAHPGIYPSGRAFSAGLATSCSPFMALYVLRNL